MSERRTCSVCKHHKFRCHCEKFNVYADKDSFCDGFERKEVKTVTNGDRIIAGGMRELAKCMVYGYRETDDNGQVTDGMLYTWKHPKAKVFAEYSEAVDYLEAWLNAPAESEVESELQ